MWFLVIYLICALFAILATAADHYDNPGQKTSYSEKLFIVFCVVCPVVNLYAACYIMFHNMDKKVE